MSLEVPIRRARRPAYRRPALGRSSCAALVALAAGAVSACGCGPSFVPVRLSEPVAATTPDMRVEIERIFLTDDVLTSAVGQKTALGVELSIENDGRQPLKVNTAALTCWMEIDAQRPGETLSLTAFAGGEGPFPENRPAGRSSQERMVAVGQRMSFWVLFHGYRYADSDQPRRITLKVPGPDGRTLDLDLANPARGRLRWNVAPLAGAWNINIRTTSLLGRQLRADAPGTAVVRRQQLGPLLLDLGLASTVLIEIQGQLTSSTSSFSASGLTASLAYPLFGWGSGQEPRRLGVFGGGAAHLLAEIPSQAMIEARAIPHLYGALAVEAGIELDVGSQRLGATVFPLSPGGRSLPRWSGRLGYTHWWFDGGGSDGYLSDIQLAW